MTNDVDTLIEALVNAHCGEEAAARQRHVMRESLRSLVRQAQAEQRLAMRQTVRRLVGSLPVSASQEEPGTSAV